mmetsp:Transcript_55129/g.128344  ORF Transcript_55129/g.128344 Transcript_55129/m.128344 type:complete len:289 (-) Transcript_55129:877-1743(-)
MFFVLTVECSQEQLHSDTGLRQVYEALELVRQGLFSFQGPGHLTGAGLARHELVVARGELQDLLACVIALLRDVRRVGVRVSVHDGLELLIGLADVTQQRLGLVERRPAEAAKGHGLGIDAEVRQGFLDDSGVANGRHRPLDVQWKLALHRLIRRKVPEKLIVTHDGLAALQELVLVGFSLKVRVLCGPDVACLLFEDLTVLLDAIREVWLRRPLKHARLTNLAPSREEDIEVLVDLVHELQVVEPHFVALEINLEEHRVVLHAVGLVDLVLASHAVGGVHRNWHRLC